MAKPTKCAHRACKCDVPEERLAQHGHYCSDECVVEGNEELCGCGHDTCALPKDHHHDESVMSVGPEDN